MAGLLANPDIEQMLDSSIDDAFGNLNSQPEIMRGFFDARFVREFMGPDGETLFIERKTETRIFFSLNVDFFNVNMVLHRGATTSSGIISMACLNLPANIRYKPEYLYLAAVIPGPTEPTLTNINHFLRPLINDMILFWKPGIQYSRTALNPGGKLVRCSLAICVCDLPAARKVAGMAGHAAHRYCTRCNCNGRKTLGRTDLEDKDWEPKDVEVLRETAKAWREADDEATRMEILQDHGLRDSVLWDLEYWNPVDQLVPDPMHCLLLNLSQNHFRDYLGLTRSSAEVIRKGDVPPAAYQYPFSDYDPNRNLLMEPPQSPNEMDPNRSLLMEPPQSPNEMDPNRNLLMEPPQSLNEMDEKIKTELDNFLGALKSRLQPPEGGRPLPDIDMLIDMLIKETIKFVNKYYLPFLEIVIKALQICVSRAPSSLRKSRFKGLIAKEDLAWSITRWVSLTIRSV